MTKDCPQLALVEALYDGRLGPQESASVERHVAVCATCGALARELDRIRAAVREPRDPATPLAHQRARHALLRRASQLPASTAPRRPMLIALAAAALTLAMVIGWIGGRATAPERALVARNLPDPRAGLETSVRPSEGARFGREKGADLDVVTLVSGTLDVAVRSLPAGSRFVVRTTDAEIEARSTAFRIDADQGRIRGVTVVEGSVEVRYAGFSAVIPGGGSWRANGDAPAAAPTASETPPPSASAAPSASAVPSASAATSESPPPRATVAAEPAKAPARALRPPASAPTVAPEASLPAPTAPTAAAPAPPPASREFAEAMQALGRGDYDGSAARLEAFSAAHPGDARADEADYVRAVALQRAGRHIEAATAARRYLETRSEGAHRKEAEQILRSGGSP